MCNDITNTTQKNPQNIELSEEDPQFLSMKSLEGAKGSASVLFLVPRRQRRSHPVRLLQAKDET